MTRQSRPPPCLRELNDGPSLPGSSKRSSATPNHVATEQLVGPQSVAELDQAKQCIPGLTAEPAWPTLRAHLLALAHAPNNDPECIRGLDLGQIR